MKGRWAQRNENGFSLIEAIISVGMVSIMAVAVVGLFSGNILSLGLSQSRATGLALANEKMEYLRDLPYDSVATQDGPIYPAGTISDNENVTRNGIKFRVNITIKYADDPFDGNLDGTVSGKPQDLYPYDYKQAEIKVYLQNNSAKVASLTTNIAAKAAETASNTGILRIKVQNANGQPVEDATVQITNTTINPNVDITTTTDQAGLVVVPKLPPDSGNDYQITVTKGGYSSEQTHDDPPGTQTATKLHPNVLVQQITDLTFSIDQPGNANITVTDTSGAPITGVNAAINGLKTIYANPTAYKYSQTRTTNASGQISLSGVEWDSYSLSLSGYYIVTTSPMQAFSVAPGSNIDVSVVATTSASWPRLTSFLPTSDVNDGSTTLTLNGANFTSGTTIKLTKAGQSDIPGTGVAITGGNEITANFNISGVAAGAWDVVITNNSGQQAVQSGGFNVATQ